MVAETKEQKDLRRNVSGAVTKVLNTVGTAGFRLPGEAGNNDEIGSMVRRCVLLALRNVDDSIRLLEREVQTELNLTISQGQLVKFYMKGGNAYSCMVGTANDVQNSRNNIGGGDSDWDTQVVVNPWLPTPIRTRLHNEVIEVALSEFRTCAQDIAHIVHGYNLDVVLDLTSIAGNETDVDADGGDVKAGQYAFVLDGQQSTRKIFSYDSIGMVFDDQVAIPAVEGTDTKDGPGILLHAAIKPFELYRLGYLGKIYRLTGPRPIPVPLTSAYYDESSLLPRKALAELIDITIPRLDTIEAFEVWESLESHHINISHESLGIRNLPDASMPIPLPDINYHKLENMLMLCEMADGSSRHYNKLPKRVRRLREACEAEVVGGKTDNEVKLSLLQMAGVSRDAELRTGVVANVARGIINGYLDEFDRVDYRAGLYDAVGSWREFIRNLMIHVRLVVTENQANLLDATWQLAEKDRQARNTDGNVARAVWAEIYNSYSTTTNTNPLRVSTTTVDNGLSVQRYRSDDLAMLDQLQAVGATSHDVDDSPLVNAGALKPSTVSHWRVFRVDDRDSMVKMFATFKTKFNMRKSSDSSLNFVHRFYTREDDRGHIPECLVIAKKGEKILSVCTIVVGADSRTGYSRMSSVDLALGKNTVAVLSDIARQRKLTAALIHDYTLTAVLSQHYGMIKQLIKVD